MSALTTIFKKFGVTLIILRSNNLRDLLGNPKDKIKGGNLGIYKMCKLCQMLCRTNKKKHRIKRFKEHLLTYNHTVKTIKLIKHMSNYKEFNK